jgi:hypothetical protein
MSGTDANMDSSTVPQQSKKIVPRPLRAQKVDLNPNAVPPVIAIPSEEEMEARKRARERGCAELHTKIRYLLSTFPRPDPITFYGLWDLTEAVERDLWTDSENKDQDVIDTYKGKVAKKVREYDNWDAVWDMNADKSGKGGQNLFREHIQTLLQAPKTAALSPYPTPSPIATLRENEFATQTARAKKECEEKCARERIREELQSKLLEAANKLSPDTGLYGFNVSQVVTDWEHREWEEASTKSKSAADYLRDFQAKISIDLGIWLQEWNVVDEIDEDEGTDQDRFCRFFNSEFGTAYLPAPTTGQDASADDDELYNLAGGNDEQSDDGVDSIYGAGDGEGDTVEVAKKKEEEVFDDDARDIDIYGDDETREKYQPWIKSLTASTAKPLESVAQEVVSPRSPTSDACSDIYDVPDQPVLDEHYQSVQPGVPEVEIQDASPSDYKEEQEIADGHSAYCAMKKAFAGDCEELDTAAQPQGSGTANFSFAPTPEEPNIAPQLSLPGIGSFSGTGSSIFTPVAYFPPQTWPTNAILAASTTNDEEMFAASANTLVSETSNSWPTQVPTSGSIADDTEMAEAASDSAVQEPVQPTTQPLVNDNVTHPLFTNTLPPQHDFGYVTPAVNPFAIWTLPHHLSQPAFEDNKPLFSFSAPEVVEPEVDMAASEVKAKVNDSSSTSSDSEGKGASSPDTEPSPPSPAKSTGHTLGVNPSLRAKSTPRRRGAIAKRDLVVTQVTKQLPLPSFQPFEVHQAEAPPALEDTTTEAVVLNEPQEEVAQLPV